MGISWFVTYTGGRPLLLTGVSGTAEPVGGGGGPGDSRPPQFHFKNKKINN